MNHIIFEGYPNYPFSIHELDKAPIIQRVTMSDIAWKIMSLSQLSVLLEVSSPKPGNVNRLRAFSDTGYRHFLASASLLGHGLFKAATRGISLAAGEINPTEVRVGNLIHDSCKDVFGGLNKSNTILGTILLYIPVVVASAAMVFEVGNLDTHVLRRWIKAVIDNSTVEDTLDVYSSFHLANPGGDRNREVHEWGEIHDRYDINNPQVLDNIRKDNISLIQMFQLSSDVEMLSKEWSNYFKVTISEVYPYLAKAAVDFNDLEEGVVRTFIWLLAKQPDGLIIKKAGLEKAKEIQAFAKRIMESNIRFDEPSSVLEELDRVLRSDGNRFNPGTTADIVSVAILLKLIEMSYGNS